MCNDSNEHILLLTFVDWLITSSGFILTSVLMSTVRCRRYGPINVTSMQWQIPHSILGG